MNMELRKAEAVVSAIIEERKPLPVELLIGEDKRRVVSIDDHATFREELEHKLEEADDL